MRDEHYPVLRVLEKEGKRLPVSIVTDSHLVAEHLKELTTLPVRVIPTHFQIPETRGSLKLLENHEQVHFYLPGIYSVTKGVPFLIQALQRLKGDPVMESMRFTIPFYPEPKKGSAMIQTMELLESLYLSQVEVLSHELDQEEYYRRISAADVILSPYDPDRYQSTSGPFAEALAFGKPVITSEKTWMSAMLERGYGAGLTFPFGDAAGLAEALRRMVGDFKELSGKAQASKEAWIETNGSQAILRELLKVF
jgi:glycosyltransferase involved in cell wall biosynthesis